MFDCAHVLYTPSIRSSPAASGQLAHGDLATVQNNQTSAGALKPETDYLLVLGRLIPAFGGLVCWKLDDHGSGVLPLALKRRQLAPACNKLPAEGRKCANNMLSIFCEHRLIVNRFYRYQIGFHRTFLPVAAFRRSSKQFH